MTAAAWWRAAGRACGRGDKGASFSALVRIVVVVSCAVVLYGVAVVVRRVRVASIER
jgi:hypothetical protein